MIVAIDGPAGAGKSTISKRVAEALGYQMIDTGAMFRVVAWRADGAGVSWSDGVQLGALARGLSFRFEMVDGTNHVWVNGEDVSGKIRTDHISSGASQVSVHPEVRAALLEVQRQLAAEGDAVMEGRDIGTVVFPDADVKIFLTASVSERARRRLADAARTGASKSLAEIEAEIEARDHRDRNRAHAPLRQADDATVVDSTSMSLDEVVEAILRLARP